MIYVIVCFKTNFGGIFVLAELRKDLESLKNRVEELRVSL